MLPAPSTFDSSRSRADNGHGAVDAAWQDRIREWNFSDLAALAARVSGARWALLTLLAPGGQCNPLVLAWSGSADDELAPLVALVSELSRDHDSIVVEDLQVDPRYAQHPALHGPLRIRGCASFALFTHAGRRLGTLSVLDPAPLAPNPEQLRWLQLLARQTATVLVAPQLQEDLDRLKSAIRVIGNDQHANLTLRSIGEGVVTTDLSGRITYLNTLAEHITGWSHVDALGKRLAQVVTLKDEDGQSLAMPELDPSGYAASPLTAKSSLVRRDGHEISIEGTFAPIVADDRSLAGTVFAFRNATLARKAVAELSHQATHDPLTGLANRRALERRLGNALKTVGENSGHALLYLDLDRFKAVNDTAGHIAGDELLRQLSGLLKQHLRETDMLARLGGDEFGVLLENCDATHAMTVAQKLRGTVEQYSFAWKDCAFDLGVSIGLVNIQDDSMGLTEILSRADEACYAAKASGRNRVHVHEPGEHERAQHHTEFEWTQEIKAALREGRMFLCSQPIMTIEPSSRGNSNGNGNGQHDLHDGHVEVLLRMRASNGAIVPPMAFLPAAERYRMMPMLDRWVLGAVLAHLRLHREDRRLHAINLSGASLLDDAFVRHVRSEIIRAGVAPQQLCFELAESVVIANLSRATEVIGELRGFGCRFAIDDFGSGMSSFGYLRHLQVDYLKIDGSLVQGVASDPFHYAMVESINRIGQLMGVRTIAEFVEDDAILDAVRTIGVDCAQGYGVGRPYGLDHVPSAP